MSEARVLPLLGALLGALLGLVTMAVLTVVGVIAPDRLPLFATVGVGIIIGAALLTQRITLAKKRLIGAIVVGTLFVGVSLTGIPEVVRGGSASADCTATGTSSLEPTPVTPANTTAVDGFSVTPTDTIEWTTQTSVPIPAATATISMQVGGIGIPLRTVKFAEAPEVTTWQGTQSVESQLAEIEAASGFLVTGIYHVAVHVEADADQCVSNAYIHVVPEGPFDTTLLKLLWAVVGVLVIALLVLTIVVRTSIRESDRSLAMVGMSAIPGETFTTAPVSPPTPTSTSRLSEPSQPTVPETSGENKRPGDGRASTPESAAKPATDRGRSAEGGATREGGVEPQVEGTSESRVEPEGDERIGEGEVGGEPEIQEDAVPEGDERIGESEAAGESQPQEDAVPEGDERIGESESTDPVADEGDTDRPSRET